MSEDAGAAAGTAEGAATTTDAGPQDTGSQGAATAPAVAAAAPGDDRSAEDLLADAVASGDDDKPEDALAQLAKLQKKNADLLKHNRTWEARAKENTAAATELQQIKDAQKTDHERLTDRAVLAEKRANEAEARYHRTLAAASYSIPPGLIDRISGSTEEEIGESAEALAAAINEAAEGIAAASARANGVAPGAVTARPQTRPVESLRPGAQPAGTPDTNDPNAWLRAAMHRQ
jgi:hypothetical protein